MVLEGEETGNLGGVADTVGRAFEVGKGHLEHEPIKGFLKQMGIEKA